MKKMLTMAVGLLTVIALFAVVAVARNSDRDGDGARTAANAVSGETAAVVDDDEGDEADADDDGDEAGDRHRLRDAGYERWGFVKKGGASRDQMSAVKDWFADQGPDWKDSYDSPAELLDALVADGVMTQEQADALAAQMEAEAERELGKLAEKGLISQEQIPAIIDWLETESATLKGLDDPAGLLADMVEDEVITQEQADSITELFAQYEEKKKGKHHRRGGDMLFGKLAAEGIISEDQLPAITAWIMEQGPDLAKDFKNPTEMLADMVEDEVITQEQADSITELFAQYEGMKSDYDGSKHKEAGSDDDDSEHGETETDDNDSPAAEV